MSGDPNEQEAAAGWAADTYFHQTYGFIPASESGEYRRVLNDCVQVLLAAVARRVEIETGVRLSSPRHPALMETQASTDGNRASREEGRMTISRYYAEVYEPFWRASTKRPGERSIPEKAYGVEQFVQLQGDKRLFEITNADLWEFAEKLGRLPSKRDLKDGWREKDAGAILKAVDSGKNLGPTMSPKTVNKRLSAISTLLKHAVSKRHIVINAARDVRADVFDEEDTGRPFDIAELNRIFSQPLFTGSMDGLEKRGILKPGPVQVRDDRFWIPLVLLLSGARSAEVVGLDCEDVVIDCETPHLVLKVNEHRRLKNRSSRRLVPIHPYLIELGFLSFARQQKQVGGRLFPLAQQQHYTDRRTGERTAKSLSNAPIMRTFNRTILERADAKKDRGSIKCFRNNFEVEAANKLPSEEENRLRLTGRSIPNSSKHYKPLSVRDPDQIDETLRVLYAAISKMTFDKVDLSKIERPMP